MSLNWCGSRDDCRCAFAQNTIVINHSDKPSCYPLAHVIEAVFVSEFPEETCQQSPLPTDVYRFALRGIERLMKFQNASLEGSYTPHSSPVLGPTISTMAVKNVNANMMCGDQPLVTPDQFEASSANIAQGQK